MASMWHTSRGHTARPLRTSITSSSHTRDSRAELPALSVRTSLGAVEVELLDHLHSKFNHKDRQAGTPSEPVGPHVLDEAAAAQG